MTRCSHLHEIQEHAPTVQFRAQNGRPVEEPLNLVGWIAAPGWRREQLEHYGIDLRLAEYDPTSGRWDQCLFSESVADMLVELSADREFPYAFEAIPSVGQLAALEAEGAGCSWPTLLLGSWITPASLEALAEAVTAGRLQSAWLRRSIRPTVECLK